MTNGPKHGIAYGEYLGADPAPGPEETIEQADTMERMLAHAKRICEDGDLILKMCMDQLSSYEIGRQLGIPQKTAYRRIQKLKSELHKYYVENFEKPSLEY